MAKATKKQVEAIAAAMPSEKIEYDNMDTEVYYLFQDFPPETPLSVVRKHLEHVMEAVDALENEHGDRPIGDFVEPVIEKKEKAKASRAKARAKAKKMAAKLPEGMTKKLPEGMTKIKK